MTSLPVCYVINTHVHPDHMLGNAAFDDEQTIFIGHEKMPNAMASRLAHYQRQFSEILGSAYNGTEFIGPDQLVTTSEPTTLDLGNRSLLLTAYTTAHTDHDLTVLDQKTNTLWTGDLLFRERIPALDGSINGWIAILEKFQQQSFHAIIPGHGPAAIGAESAVWQPILTYLKTVRTDIREIIQDMGTIDQATETVAPNACSNWQLFQHYHRRNVTAAFVELEWE
ncbi:metallo-beta-lactamase family protein [Methylophaga frappieri]|uniref:Metallo-beta-lactamase family protein n=1 Tax=Methylophaga frappieri (strain ATCC BAA-2434 / DSM 25690 / JAM7) TaxID=754477 RepID=I1YK99_METFJ|nr:metallo-beta-lactamase family protein [Methylophaga frappieri]